MPIILVEDTQEYEASGTVFVYERLRYDDRQKLLYLLTERGTLDQPTYDKACVAVSLKGWHELYGKNGAIAFPVAGDGAAAKALPRLPGLSPAEQQRLDAVFYVVDHLPLEIQTALVQRVNELAPEELKKSFEAPLSVSMSSSTATLGESSPVSIVEASTPQTVAVLPVMPEVSTLAPIGAATGAAQVSL